MRIQRKLFLLLPLPRIGGEGRGEGGLRAAGMFGPLTLALSPDAGERGPELGTMPFWNSVSIRQRINAIRFGKTSPPQLA